MIFVYMRYYSKQSALVWLTWAIFDIERHRYMCAKIVEVAAQWECYELKVVFNRHWIC